MGDAITITITAIIHIIISIIKITINKTLVQRAKQLWQQVLGDEAVPLR